MHHKHLWTKFYYYKNKYCDIFLKKDVLCHTAPLFKTSNILQIENLYRQKILQKVHKIYYSSSNESFSDHATHAFQKQIFLFHFPVPLQVNEPHIIGSQLYGTG